MLVLPVTANLSYQHPTILFNELDNVFKLAWHVITPWLYYIIRTEYVQVLDTQKEDGAHRPLFIYLNSYIASSRCQLTT